MTKYILYLQRKTTLFVKMRSCLHSLIYSYNIIVSLSWHWGITPAEDYDENGTTLLHKTSDTQKFTFKILGQ